MTAPSSRGKTTRVFLSRPICSSRMFIFSGRRSRPETSAINLWRSTSAISRPWAGGRLRLFCQSGSRLGLDVAWIDAFFAGLKRLARTARVRLLGGDTTRSPGPLIINLCVLGRIHPDRIKFRSGARPGDIIAVTGRLGDSGAGLRLLLEERPLGRDERYLVRRHHRPRAHLSEGVWLARHGGVTAMMDVSDGIDSDIRRIMERSGCGAVINLDRLPLSPRSSSGPPGNSAGILLKSRRPGARITAFSSPSGRTGSKKSGRPSGWRSADRSRPWARS